MEISHRQAEVCAALADYHRMMLLYAVADTPRSVSDLVRRVGLSQPAVSRHLRIMRESGVVVAERRGKSIFYIVKDRRIVQAMDLLRTSLSEQMQQQGEVAHTAAQRPPV
jgi:DNA-binding transcriptional ArsR family regulator